ncbi:MULTISPECIES: methylated-DNA--[protein]-cysteine S-methyltransferase [unclassified Clostridium]|uniref:methylated-DNA--[protein]-cysteine S-methyltransferase n=1 Tax=Clostridium TaxID=1485 RepID=UPI001C8B6981|nr:MULTISPECIES: methylated-DNA--[protein]-cysteine S-methyltransferase [unclassified Clostridium]MBX9138283.1 methylated-DNA--[protein]-cysteine S-methyltransferase [Clostridium sp. K12(2020)]MBX9144999.1 methylated-DNA--[protein]-cysteine S-methyltransferase [Clostridium sp. K13]MDU2290220.1 methylated-DNA--[protein]-cysteine S-methyltransferase [Clostridium celatum]MDU4325018.1 methylated-DNA--[protein]-cysteine S-methyltransferase [Clostridium celatum]
MSFSYYDSELGKIKIEVEDKYIIGVNFVSDIDLPMDEINNENEKSIISKCKNQLEEYFNGERKNFELEIKFIKGTNFQKCVWSELCKINYGETLSYKQVAERIGKPNAYRAVGGANNKNPIAIIVPCHRVIGKNGAMVGYADGIDKKEFLLKLERK